MARFNRLTRSSNPVMTEKAFQQETYGLEGESYDTMTIQGAINKTFILFGLMILTAAINFSLESMALTILGALGGLGVVIYSVFKRKHSATTAPLYAILEGFFVGGITAMYATLGGGIVIQAVSLTLMVLFIMLFIHKTGIIPVTDKFRMGVFMATGAIFMVYLMSFILGFFGINVPYIHEGGTIGILISLAIIVVAALNLLLDFDNFEKGEKYGAPLYMEWFVAMGLMITLVWLYIEMLRLLAKLSSSD